MSFIFEKLEVYQKSLDFAYKITELTNKFPKGNYYLVDQLNRASLSIPANIAEGNGRFHKADRKNFFYIARGSVHECVSLIEIANRKSFIENCEYQDMRKEIESIAKMLSGLIKGIQ